jgi:hypothetical protein
MSSNSTTVPQKKEFPTRPKKRELIALYCPANQGKRKFINRVNNILEKIYGNISARKNQYIEQKELQIIVEELGLPKGYCYEDIIWFQKDKI